MRTVTRLSYPLPAQVRHLGVGLFCRALGRCLAPWFRRSVEADRLATARILILKPCCLGDVVFATPLIRELRQTFPRASLTFAVGAHSRPVVARNPYLDDLLDTGPVGSGPFDLKAYLDLARRLRARRFDVCFVLERSALLALLPLLAGIPRRIGIDSGGRGFSLSVAVSPRPPRPESELYLDLARAVGVRPSSGALEFHPSAVADERVAALVAEAGLAGVPLVVLHCAGGTNPGMVLTRKRWPTESFAELARRIVRTGAAVVLVGAPEDRPVVEQVLAGLATERIDRIDSPRRHSAESPSLAPGRGLTTVPADTTEGESLVSPPRESGRGSVLDLVGRLSLDEVAALARRAAVYVGNDSGPSHLAEAAGARVVMLFGPSDPLVYGPRSRRAVALTAGLWCSPCFEDGRVPPCANVLCLRSISVERVWREVAAALGSEIDRR